MSATITRKNPGALKKIYAHMADSGKRVVAVGFPAGQQNAYPDGTQVASVAAAQVFGVPSQGIPVRDFMALARPDMRDHQQEVVGKVPFFASLNFQVNTLLAALGEYAVSDIRKAIIDLNEPPLAESTKAMRDEKQHRKAGKGDYKPLIDTHHMIESVSYIVRDKN